MTSDSVLSALPGSVGVPATGGASTRLMTVRRWLVAALTIGLAASISLSEVVLVLLAVTAMFVAPAGSRRVRWPLALPIVAFAVWTIVSALASAQPVDSLRATKPLMWLGVMYVVLHALPDRAAAHRFVTLLFVAVSVVAGFAIVQVMMCPAAHEATGLLRWFFHGCSRARGFFSIYMTLAGVLTPVLITRMPALATVSRRSWWIVPAWLVGVLALGLTYVRGAWLGFATGAGIGALATRRRIAMLAAIVLIAAGASLMLPGVAKRASTLGQFTADDTTRDRLAMMHGGWRMLREHPLTGVGIGQVKRLYPDYAPPEALRHSTSHLHNTPLQILVERGAVGLALWLAVYAAFFVRAGRTLRRIPAAESRDRALVLGVIAAVAAFLVAGLFEYNFGDTEVLFVVNALMSVPFVIDRSLDAAAIPSPS